MVACQSAGKKALGGNPKVTCNISHVAFEKAEVCNVSCRPHEGIHPLNLSLNSRCITPRQYYVVIIGITGLEQCLIVCYFKGA